MADYTKVNLVDDVQDMAPRFDLSPGLESHFARTNLGLEQSGMSFYRIAPGFRVPFGHRHGQQEEVYVIVSGSARIKLGDDIVDLQQWDAVRVPGETWRALEGGSDGAEVLRLRRAQHGQQGRADAAGLVERLTVEGRLEGAYRP